MFKSVFEDFLRFVTFKKSITNFHAIIPYSTKWSNLMTRIEKSIEIQASPEEVWPLVYWDRVPQWMDQIKKAKYTSKEKEGVGVVAHVCAEAAGIKSEWDAETTEWTEGRRYAWRTTAGTFTGIGSMTLIPNAAGTEAIFMMDYDLPYSIFGKIVDKLRVCRAIEKGTEQGLEKLKSTLESAKKEKKKNA
jgi:uncharacterized membrane protein